MRLWQKIYFITLVLVLEVISIVPTAVLVRDQKAGIRLAAEEAKQASLSAVRETKSYIQRVKTENGKFLFTVQELERCLDGNVESLQKTGMDVEILSGEKPIPGDPDSPILNHMVDVSEIPQATARTGLTERGGEKYIEVKIPVFLEGRYFQMKAARNVTEMFLRFDSEIRFIRLTGAVTAVIAAGILLAAILWLTKPLKELDRVTERIAEGQYQERAVVRGRDEISELAEHMNKMAERIEEHVGETTRLAESRSVFIANMTHELKTPLTSILGFANILKIKSSVSDEQRMEYAAIIEAEAKRLRGLSSKLMELITLREEELQLHSTQLAPVLERVTEHFASICGERNLEIRCGIQQMKVDMDEELFTSLLYNLLDNACKASKSGQTIELKSWMEGNKAMIQVRDHGIGIPKEQVDYVTEAFYMVDKSRSRKAGGAGIGLALCKEIVRAHHGEMNIESEPGCGTSVTLNFPASGREER